MKKFLISQAIPWVLCLAGCGDGHTSPQQSKLIVDDSLAVAGSSGEVSEREEATSRESSAAEDISAGALEGKQDVCLMLKARVASAQCLIGSLKGFEISSKPHEGSIGFIACRPVKGPTLDKGPFLGDYPVRTMAFPGVRRNIAQVSVKAQEPDIFDDTREGEVGTIRIFEVDDAGSGVVRGEIFLETAEHSGIFIHRPFRAIFLGYFFETHYLPNPDHVWEGKIP